jgi:membrane-bound inhibitor of C-type lysozyme
MAGRLMLALLAAGIVGAMPARAQTFNTYRCRDGTQFVAAFYHGSRSAYLKLGGRAMTLPWRMSATGARYSGGGTTLRIRGRSVTLTRGRQSTDCLQD